jgi:hypothetical protein
MKHEYSWNDIDGRRYQLSISKVIEQPKPREVSNEWKHPCFGEKETRPDRTANVGYVCTCICANETRKESGFDPDIIPVGFCKDVLADGYILSCYLEMAMQRLPEKLLCSRLWTLWNQKEQTSRYWLRTAMNAVGVVEFYIRWKGSRRELAYIWFR